MINRLNYHDVQKYLTYCQDVRKNSDATVERKRWHMRHPLEWADQARFTDAAKITPSFPKHLSERDLAHSTQTHICQTFRDFLTWAKDNLGEYKRVAPALIESLKPVQDDDGAPQSLQVWTLEAVRKIASFEPPTLTMQREQAAVVMMFLSGMRVGALVTLPIAAVNIQERMIMQWPRLGVHTKKRKPATTFLLPIPDLLDVVQSWDDLVRAQLHKDDPWYAHIQSDGTGLLPGQPITDTRRSRVRKGMRQLCELAGVEYKRPHALRHGYAHYAITHAQTMDELKAASQNMMHEHLSTTEGVYAKLVDDELQTRIAKLTEERNADTDLSAFRQEVIATIQAELRKHS